MAAVKSAARVSEKWARVTPQRSTDYEAGVKEPRTPWAAATGAANDRYKAGVQEAATANRFQKNVAAAGDATWLRKTLAKGPARFAEGVQLSGPDYEAAVKPYLDTIAATALPPRGPKGSPQNLQRVAVLASALRKKKTG